MIFPALENFFVIWDDDLNIVSGIYEVFALR
jgi:hypothetical protein